jgi:hypothetical protein
VAGVTGNKIALPYSTRRAADRERDRGESEDQEARLFFGHSKLETTQVYAESTTEMIKDSHRRALAE